MTRLFGAIALIFLAIGPCDAGDPLTMHILSNGHVRFASGPELDREQLRVKIHALMKLDPPPDIQTIPDRTAPYDVVANVLQVFQREGYGHIGFTGVSQ